jgi:hypothetical protein
MKLPLKTPRNPAPVEKVELPTFSETVAVDSFDTFGGEVSELWETWNWDEFQFL